MINRAEIERRIQIVNRYAHKLEEFARLDTGDFIADPHLSVCAERYLQLACEACIEISLMLVSGLGLRRPRSYDDLPGILTEAGFITDDYAPHVERLIKVRDFLVHGYSGVEPHALHNQLNPRIMELEFFVSQAGSFVRRHE